MKKEEPLELGLRMLEDRDVVRHNEFRFITTDFGFVNNFIKMEPILFKLGQPYRMQEGRIAFPTTGSARVLINLIEHTFEAGALSLITPNSIIQMLEISPDFNAQMMAVGSNFLPISGKEDFFSHFLQRQRNILLSLSPEEHQRVSDFFSIIWSILQEPVFRREAVQHLVASLLYNIEYITKNKMQKEDSLATRQEEIFQRFISLVNTHSKTERNVRFYADKLCLTPRYLNTVIRQTSRQTVMDWLNQSIILEAKVLLKHSNHLVYQISDELNFPNPSFFCKFFKRMTGMTPQAYQKK